MVEMFSTKDRTDLLMALLSESVRIWPENLFIFLFFGQTQFLWPLYHPQLTELKLRSFKMESRTLQSSTHKKCLCNTYSNMLLYFHILHLSSAVPSRCCCYFYQRVADVGTAGAKVHQSESGLGLSKDIMMSTLNLVGCVFMSYFIDLTLLGALDLITILYFSVSGRQFCFV